MWHHTRQFLPSVFLFLGLSIPACAQFGSVEGYVVGPDNKPVAGAVINFDKLDAKLHQEIKSDKKGYFNAMGVPVGDYDVTVTVDNVVRDKRDVFHVSPGRQSATYGNSAIGLVFRLKSVEAAKAEAEKAEAAADGGAKSKAREEVAKQNQVVGESFAAANSALAKQQWDEAIASLEKAVAADPKQAGVWSALSDAWLGKSRKQQGAEAQTSYQNASEAFANAIQLAPTNAGFYNNYALALANAGKLDEANTNLAKAIELDPAGAGKYNYNLGVLLLNQGKTAQATEQFKKAVTADPNYAEAHYQYGTALLAKATTDASGKLVAPEAADEFKKYLALAPNGPNSQAAKDVLSALGAK